MLYDPKWEAQTKPDVFSLECLIAWLETMPADGVYCFVDNGGCLLHRYFSASGVNIKSVGGYTYTLRTGEGNHLPEAFDDIAADTPHTFGAALSRARKALAS